MEEQKTNDGNGRLVLVTSDQGDGGWSLHAPGTTDEAIRSGEAKPLASGPSDRDPAGNWLRPDAADRQRALAELALRTAPTREAAAAQIGALVDELAKRVQVSPVVAAPDEGRGELVIVAEVDTGDAIRRGHATGGGWRFKVSAATLASWTEEERESLACAAEGTKREIRLRGRLTAPTIDEVRRLLREAAQERAERTASRERIDRDTRERDERYKRQSEARAAAFMALSDADAVEAVRRTSLHGGSFERDQLIGDRNDDALRRYAALLEIVAAERAERARASKEAEQAAKVADAREMREWIEAHGKPRLRRCLAEGIECRAVYRDERLAAERPGWQWYQPLPGVTDEPRNPPGVAFDILDEARKVEPAAVLRRYVIEHEHDEDCDGIGGDSDCAAFDLCCYVAQSAFLGEPIVFFGERAVSERAATLGAAQARRAAALGEADHG